MFRLVLLLLLSLILAGIALVWADEDYPARIRETLDYLAKYPEDVPERVRLGYDYMQTGDFRKAAQAYEQVVARDSFSIEGWKGLIGSWNALKEWDKTLGQGRRASSLVGEDPDLVLMTAYAAFENGDYLLARQLYLRSLQKDRAGPVNTAGLGWTYLRLGNPALARRYFSQSEGLARSTNRDNPFRNPFLTVAPELYILFQKQNETALNLGTTVFHSTYRWSAAADLYLKSGKRFRTDYLLGWSGSSGTLDYLIQGHYLYGSSRRLYPGFSAVAGLSIPLYGSRGIVTPGLTQAYSSYPSVRSLQTEGYLSSRQARFYEALSLYVLHQRYVNPDSARNRVCLQGTLGYQGVRNVDFYLLAGYGPKAFLVSKHGFIVDNFKAPDREAALLVDYHLQGFNLEGMFKRSRENNRWGWVSYFSLSKGFRFPE